MAIPLPSQVPLTGAPAWAGTVQTAINAALNSPAWPAGTRTRNVTLTAAQFGVVGIDAATYDLFVLLLKEYVAAGYQVTPVGSSPPDAQGRITSTTIEFARWPA